VRASLGAFSLIVVNMDGPPVFKATEYQLYGASDGSSCEEAIGSVISSMQNKMTLSYTQSIQYFILV